MSPAQIQAFDALYGQPSPLLMERLAAIERQNAAILAALERKGDEDRWLDSAEAVAYLGMCETTFETYRSASQKNRIPGHKVGGKLKFKRSELDRWVKLWEVRAAGLA